MANHATIIRTTPVLLADLHMKKVGSHCLEGRPNNKHTCSCALISLLLQRQLSVLICMKSQTMYHIL